MHRIINEDRVPVFLWVDLNFEESALQQARNIANLPFTYHHVAIMPDGHFGYGAPIGAVAGLMNVVVPNFVGKDIGCGMCAIKTPWTVEEIGLERLKKIMGKVRETVPVGFKHQSTMQDRNWMPDTAYPDGGIVQQEYDSARKQMGTLGGGNHFIEFQRGAGDLVWIMIHSGSRNLGNKVAMYYDKRAQGFNEIYRSSVPKNWQLAFLPQEADDYNLYMMEMQFCVDFALCNREHMMYTICRIFDKVINHKKIDMDNLINVAHNYARLENHYGKNLLVHRKGATSARAGEIGIIPGNQGAASYIVRGLGNPESFMSCSHGAGRKMGRKEARRKLNLAEEKAHLDEQGILHAIRGKNDLDEASGAYKDIHAVMANQSDLVEIVEELKPLAVIKG